jgi:DNA repair protein RadC
MLKSNLKRVSRISTRSTAGSRRAAAKGHTVARYRLRLVKEDEEPVSEPESLNRSAEVAAFLWRRIFDGLDREAMCAVYADNSNRVIGWTVAYVGCLSRCSVEPRGLVVPALLSNSASVFIAHNHPSGSAEPSAEDKLFTRRMAHACEVLGLRLADSLVVAEGPAGPRWTSLLSAANE